MTFLRDTFSQVNTPGTHYYLGGWVGPRASVDAVERTLISLSLLGIEPRFLGYPARSPLLDRLS
jgi:hypothetical protein